MPPDRLLQLLSPPNPQHSFSQYSSPAEKIDVVQMSSKVNLRARFSKLLSTPSVAVDDAPNSPKRCSEPTSGKDQQQQQHRRGSSTSSIGTKPPLFSPSLIPPDLLEHKAAQYASSAALPPFPASPSKSKMSLPLMRGTSPCQDPSIRQRRFESMLDKAPSSTLMIDTDPKQYGADLSPPVQLPIISPDAMPVAGSGVDSTNASSTDILLSPSAPDSVAKLITKKSKFDIFIERAEAKLAQREEMIVLLSAETQSQEETIQSLLEEVTRLQKQLVKEQDAIRDGTSESNQGQDEISAILNTAFHEFNVYTDIDESKFNPNDFVCLEATYIRRLCQQVYDSTMTKKRMEKQLPFVKGMCDQVVESLRDKLASVEHIQAHVEHQHLNVLSSKSAEQAQLELSLSSRLQQATEALSRLEQEVEQDNFTGKALRDALTQVETEKAQLELLLLNQLSTMHAEKKEMEEEYQHQLQLKNELATHMQATMERTRFNYRASGLFTRSKDEEDSNAIVLEEEGKEEEIAWGFSSSPVAQAFRNTRTQDSNYVLYSTQQQNSPLPSGSAPFYKIPQTREEKLWNRTRDDIKKALDTLELVGGDINLSQCQSIRVASNINEALKKTVGRIEIESLKLGIDDIDIGIIKDEATSALLGLARDKILSMLIEEVELCEPHHKEEVDKHKPLVEEVLISLHHAKALDDNA